MYRLLQPCRTWALVGALSGAVVGGLLLAVTEGIDKVPVGGVAFAFMGCLLGAMACITVRGAGQLGLRKVAVTAFDGAWKGLLALLLLRWLGFSVLGGGWGEAAVAALFFAMVGVFFEATEVLAVPGKMDCDDRVVGEA